MIHAQLVFPFAAGPVRPVQLAAAWVIVLDTLRRACRHYSFYTDDVAHAVKHAVPEEYRAARARVPGAVARLRVMRAIRGTAASAGLP